MLTTGPVARSWAEDHVVEETISGAIEHVLGNEKSVVWSDGRAVQKPAIARVTPAILTYKNPLGQELPLPPADDAVPVIPHATVRRYPGRLVDCESEALGGPITPDSTERSFGPAMTPPRMPYRPQLALPKVLLSPALSNGSSEESMMDFEDFSESAPETTLIRI